MDSFPVALDWSQELPLSLIIGLAIALVVVISRAIPAVLQWVLGQVGSVKVKEFYLSVVKPHHGLVGWVISLAIADLSIIVLLKTPWAHWVELSTSLALAIAASWLGSRLFSQFFDVYLLDAAVRNGRKVNSEFLMLAKFFANFAILVIAVIAFAQTHAFNVFGLVASLGIGGLAIAFAAQKVLEQLLGGVVLYLDRPFVVDDYIGLPDGVFGRVESIGLRSTKIRTSGKGTLVIVPNNALTQATIENFTGAKKVMSIVYLNFYREVLDQEAALIRQVILDSTKGIFGLDARSTDVTFRELEAGARTQAQITFFILGSGEISMDLRRQLLDIANQKITQQLKEYGIAFEIEEPTLYVDSPITV